MAHAAVPTGTFPVKFAPSALTALRGSKKRAADDELVAFRYTFKPASVNSDTPGILENAPAGDRVVSFDLPTGGSQVFDVREESSKPRECVLVWDEETRSFTLHALPTTLHLSQNRTLSAQRPAGGFPQPEKPTKTKRGAAAKDKAVPWEELPSGVRPAAAPKKKAPAKAKKPPAKSAAKKAAPKKGAKKAAPPPTAKVKSVEIIEDSDEGDDGLDEFADMLGAAIEEEQYDEEEEEEEEGEEEEDDELGGAHYAGYGAQAAGDDEEWI